MRQPVPSTTIAGLSLRLPLASSPTAWQRTEGTEGASIANPVSGAKRAETLKLGSKATLGLVELFVAWHRDESRAQIKAWTAAKLRLSTARAFVKAFAHAVAILANAALLISCALQSIKGDTRTAAVQSCSFREQTLH